MIETVAWVVFLMGLGACIPILAIALAFLIDSLTDRDK